MQPGSDGIDALDTGHLFHASEEHDIAIFRPRTPPAPEVGRTAPCVWSISFAFLANYLAPRDCPRVIFGAGPETRGEDRARFIGDCKARRIVTIERGWRSRMEDTAISIYAFARGNHWALFDPVCEVFVTEQSVTPIARHHITSPAGALQLLDAELREMDNLWPLIDAVAASSLNFSIIRKRNALPRQGNR